MKEIVIVIILLNIVEGLDYFVMGWKFSFVENAILFGVLWLVFKE